MKTVRLIYQGNFEATHSFEMTKLLNTNSTKGVSIEYFQRSAQGLIPLLNYTNTYVYVTVNQKYIRSQIFFSSTKSQKLARIIEL